MSVMVVFVVGKGDQLWLYITSRRFFFKTDYLYTHHNVELIILLLLIALDCLDCSWSSDIYFFPTPMLKVEKKNNFNIPYMFVC